jgi:hypothetical protein
MSDESKYELFLASMGPAPVWPGNVCHPSVSMLDWFAAIDRRLQDWEIHNFSAKELCGLNGAATGEGAWAIPPVDLWGNLEWTVKAAQHVRDAAGCGFVVVSGFRPKAYNDRCGGKPASKHLVFGALDLRPISLEQWGTYERFADWGAKVVEAFGETHKKHTGVGRYPTKGFIHVDVGHRSQNTRWTG